MTIILVTFLAFLVPVAIYLFREWRKVKEKEAKEGLPLRKKEPVSVAAAAKVALVMLAVALPVYFLSDSPHSYYANDDGVLKVAFKHTGSRVSDCEEADIIRLEGERYRQELKDTRQVKMSIEKLARCPRERHPVMVELHIDGKLVLDKSYAPTGLKKDMASYIYDEFPVTPGAHDLSMLLFDSGSKDSPAYTFEGRASFKPREVKVIWMSDKAGSLVIN